MYRSCSDPKDGSRRKLTYAAPGRLARMLAGGIHDENCMDQGAFSASVHVFFRRVPFSGRGAVGGAPLVRHSLSLPNPPHPTSPQTNSNPHGPSFVHLEADKKVHHWNPPPNLRYIERERERERDRERHILFRAKACSGLFSLQAN